MCIRDRSHEERAEAIHLAMIHRNMITPQGSRPVMGAVQDTLTSMRLLTARWTFLDRAQVGQLAMFGSPVASGERSIPPPAIRVRGKDGNWKELWTGKQ